MGSKPKKKQKKTKSKRSKNLPGTQCSQPQESEFQDQNDYSTKQPKTNPMSFDQPLGGNEMIFPKKGRSMLERQMIQFRHMLERYRSDENYSGKEQQYTDPMHQHILETQWLRDIDIEHDIDTGLLLQRREIHQKKQIEKKQIEGQHLCLLYGKPYGLSWMDLLVIDVSEDGLAKRSFTTVELKYWRPGIGFGSLGSKCYVIGGDMLNHGGPKDTYLFPRRVYVCDLRKLSKGWKKGPQLVGGKPFPIIATVNDRLYALAGYSTAWIYPSDRPKNLFEVYEPTIKVWRVLPEPPFIKSYENFEGHPEFQGHTIIGSVIYFQVAFSGKPNLFSFNVDTERWHKHCGGSKNSFCSPPEMDDLILHNLRVTDWKGRGDVVDYLLFQTFEDGLKNVTVFAYDLTSEMVDAKDVTFNDLEYFIDSGDDDNKFFNDSCKKGNSSKCDQHDFTDDDYVLVVDDNVPTVPVLGLTGITRFLPKIAAFDSFITHIGGNLFSLVSRHRCVTLEKFGKGLPPSKKFAKGLPPNEKFAKGLPHRACERVRVCVFQASFIECSDGTKFDNRYVAGYNVTEAVWKSTGEMGELVAWCKVPNDGHQSRFRRPHYHHGTSYDSYVDRVAGGAIRYKNAYNSHVRRVNLP